MTGIRRLCGIRRATLWGSKRTIAERLRLDLAVLHIALTSDEKGKVPDDAQQASDLSCGRVPDNSAPALHGNPCRQGHETLRPNLRKTDFVIAPSTMINAIYSAVYGRFR
jgi:hypothetical protein